MRGYQQLYRSIHREHPLAQVAMDARSSSSAGQAEAPDTLHRTLDLRRLQLLTRQWEADATALLRPAAHQRSAGRPA